MYEIFLERLLGTQLSPFSVVLSKRIPSLMSPVWPRRGLKDFLLSSSSELITFPCCSAAKIWIQSWLLHPSSVHRQVVPLPKINLSLTWLGILKSRKWISWSHNPKSSWMQSLLITGRFTEKDELTVMTIIC